MNKYEIIFESLQGQLDNGLISEELANEVNDIAYTKYVIEGAGNNLKSEKAFFDRLKSYDKEYCDLAEKLRKLVDDGKYAQAIAVYKKMNIALEKFNEDCKGYRGSYSGAFLMMFLNNGKSFLKTLAFHTITNTAIQLKFGGPTAKKAVKGALIGVGTGAASAGVESFIKAYPTIKANIKKKQENGEEITAKDYNVIRVKIEAGVKDRIKENEKNIELLKKAMKSGITEKSLKAISKDERIRSAVKNISDYDKKVAKNKAYDFTVKI